MKIVKITAVALAALLLMVIVAGIYVKNALPDTGPAPDITFDRTPIRLERGKYLATHVAVCMDCHTLEPELQEKFRKQKIRNKSFSY